MSKSHQMEEFDRKFSKKGIMFREKIINESGLKPEGADIPLGIACLLLHLLKLHCLGANIAQFFKYCIIILKAHIAQF